MKYVRSSRTDQKRRPRTQAMLEELESRVLLSHGTVAATTKATTATSAAAITATTYFSILATSNSTTAAGAGGYTPAQIKSAYGIDSITFGSIVGDGTGQIIAIVDAYDDPNIAKDLATFSTTYGLSAANLIKINQNGGTSLPSTDPSGRGDSWAVEISLDVEWAHAIAPGATIVLVEASSDSESDLLKAVNTARNYAGVSVVSTSWGSSESSSDTASDKYFTTPSGHTNITFVASAGDNGAYGDGFTRTKSVEYPASSTNVLAVGGTSLTVTSDGAYFFESGWGDGTRSGSDGGSGGGVSVIEKQPVWQSGVVTQSLTYRAVPDVSIVADPATGVNVIDSWDSPSSPWMVIGGTSLSAPVWGALIAIADQGRVIDGESTLTTSQTLTLLYSAPSTDFHDITTGSNGYSATTGYDLVTGLGTPIANLLIAYLADSTSTTTPVTDAAPTIASFSASPSSFVAGNTLTLTASGVADTDDTVTSVTFYLESNSSSGLQTSSDTLVGSGTQNGSTWTLTAATTGMTAGTYTYYAVATDAAGTSSTSAVATVTVTGGSSVSAVDNDNFVNATTISGTSVTVTGTNVGATKEKGEPKTAGKTGGVSVWFVWTAAVTGKVSLTTAGSDFDTLLAVYTGTQISKLKKVASNDDDDADFVTTSALTFDAVAGTTYRIAVDGYKGSTGSITLTLNQTEAPSNDMFVNAITVTGDTFTWTGTNDGATRETSEPKIANNVGGSSVWLTWTATSSETVTLSTAGSNFDTLLGVYTGKKVSALAKVASNNDDLADGLDTSLVTFKAVAGKTYYFVIDGSQGADGMIDIAMSRSVSHKPTDTARTTGRWS